MSTASPIVLSKQCPGCAAAFATQQTLNFHVERFNHYLPCTACGRRYASKEARNAHFRDSKAHPNCTLCDVGFENHNVLDAHTKEIHGGSSSAPQDINCSISPAPLSLDQIPRTTFNNAPIAPVGAEPHVLHCYLCDSDFNDIEVYTQHCIQSHFKRDPIAKNNAEQDMENVNLPVKNVEISILSMPEVDNPASSSQNAVQQESVLLPETTTPSSPTEAAEVPPSHQTGISVAEVLFRHSSAASQVDAPDPIALLQAPHDVSKGSSVCPSPVPSAEERVEPNNADKKDSAQASSSSTSPVVQLQSSADHIESANACSANGPDALPSPQVASSYESVTRISTSSYTTDTKLARRASKATDKGRSRSSHTATDVRYPFTSRSRHQTPVPRCWDAESTVDPAPSPRYVSHIYCRACRLDPCVDVTATMCGHIFCNKCITEAVIKTSQCPACRTPILLYSLFKLHL